MTTFWNPFATEPSITVSVSSSATTLSMTHSLETPKTLDEIVDDFFGPEDSSSSDSQHDALMAPHMQPPSRTASLDIEHMILPNLFNVSMPLRGDIQNFMSSTNRLHTKCQSIIQSFLRDDGFPSALFPTYLVSFLSHWVVQCEPLDELIHFLADQSLPKHVYTRHYLHSVLTHTEKTFDELKNRFVRAVNCRTKFDADEIAVETIRRPLASGSLYWYGYTKDGCPILWTHPNAKEWENFSLDEELALHSFLIEYGLRYLMPHECQHKFVLAVGAGSFSFQQFKPQLMMNLANMLREGYIDRLSRVIVFPVGTVLKMVYSFVEKFLADRTREVISIANTETGLDELCQLLPNGMDDVPIWMGGSANHDEIRDSSTDRVSFELMDGNQAMLRQRWRHSRLT